MFERIVCRSLQALPSMPKRAPADLSGVSSIEPACAAVFPAAWRESGGWPGVSLSLCAVNPKVQARLKTEGTSRFVPIHDDVAGAVLAAQCLPPYVSQTTHLRFDLLAPRDARTSTRATFELWGLQDQADNALLVVSEMVSNCVRHGAPPLRLTLRLRGGLLRIAVDDAGSGRPRPVLRSVTADSLIDGVLVADNGRGLPLVEAIASAWGASENEGGTGKTIWCELRVRSAA